MREEAPMSKILNALKWLDKNIEKWLIIVTYAAMSTIVFMEVCYRFFFNRQHVWSTSVAIYLFIFIAWIGASYIARQRSHLSFPAVRMSMGYTAQFFCLCLDWLCWITLSWFAFVASWENINLMMLNWAMVPGTSIMLWPFYLSIPIGWALLVWRVTANLAADIRNFRKGDPLLPGCPGRKRTQGGR